MIEVKTETTKQTNQYPTEFDLQQILSIRDPNFSDDERLKLKYLERGLAGEEKVFDFLNTYGKQDWVAIRNLWLNNNHNFEIDLLLLTNYCVYTFEIKHYTGNFTYEDGLCLLRNQPTEVDPIQQARRNAIRLNKIFQSYHRRVEMKHVVLFISELNQVHIKSPVDDLDILQLTDLYEYIQHMIREENSRQHMPISQEDILDHLSQFEVIHPYLPKPVPTETLQNLRTGIHCARCSNFNLEKTKTYFICPCGLHESREEAIIRTTCDYSALTYDRNFKVSDIYNFINRTVAHSTLKRYLDKNFIESNKQRYNDYKSIKLPYKKCYQLFNMPLPVKFYASRDNLVYIFK